MKKILIITGDKCDDFELFYPYYRLKEENYHVDIVSFNKGVIKAKHFFELEADEAVSAVSEKDYDALLLPGGSAPEKLRQDEFVKEITKAFYNAKKPIAAICHGPQILISANVVKGERMTCYPGIADDLKNAGAIYSDEAVVVSENKIVTSRRPEDLSYFMREFVKIVNDSIFKEE